METYTEFPVSPRLSRYVECYWSREDQAGTPEHSVLPDGCVDILFSERAVDPVELFVVGLMTARQRIEVAAGQYFFGVRFRPGMAAAFIPEAVQLTDKTEPIESVLGKSGRQLLEQLAECTTPVQRIAVMERFLRPLEPSDGTERAIARLTEFDLSVDAAASDSGISVRQLRRVCLERSGVSPKYLTRILRFRRAAQRIHVAARGIVHPDWAEFAVECGYFDQAHFIREFREFTGCTPGRFLQSLPRRTS